MKTLSLVTGFIIPFVVFWLVGVLLQIRFMLGGPKGTNIVLVGAIAAVLSLLISYFVSSKYKEKFIRNSLLTGNLIAFILWTIGLLQTF